MPDGVAEDGSPIPVPEPTDPRLGRIPQFDLRSRAFQAISDEQRRTLTPRSYTWSCAPRLNQGQEGTCVGHAIAHELCARPVVKTVDHLYARGVYADACMIDPWTENDGPDYSFGTSVLAGMQVIYRRGLIKEFRWCFSIDDVILVLGYRGPVVLGINWTSEMFNPRPVAGLDLPVISTGGGVQGGHAILANGVSLKNGVIRLHNSWGSSFGLNGECFIRIEDLDRLLQENGDAAVPSGRSLGG